LLHLVVVHHEELVLEIAGERRRTTSGNLSGVFCFLMAICVPSFVLTALDTSFPIDRNAVVANHEKLSPETWRNRWATVVGALGVRLRAFLQDGVECFVRMLLDLHHVHRWCRLVGLREIDLVEVVDMAALGVVDEEMVHDVLTDQTCTH